MKTFRFLCTILCVGLLGGVILSGCADSDGPDNAPLNRSMGGGYVWGLPYISEDAKAFATKTDEGLDYEYKRWKDLYVEQSPSGHKRVRRDKNSQFDTVSEGIGYGMLLAVYFNDQPTFDSLYRFCQEHWIFYPEYIPLMHWKTNSEGRNVSEFADYDIDKSVITLRSGQKVTSRTAEVPHGAVFGNLTDGTVFILDYYENEETSPTIQYLDNSPNYYRMFKPGGKRHFSTATDADEDIAAALAFASKVWKSSPMGIDYRSEARQMIKAIQKYDFKTDGFIKAGNAWGDRTCWNPSYFTPAYYLNVYASICPEDAGFWRKAYTTMYDEMYKVANAAKSRSGSTSKIFFPDWCDTSAYTDDNPVISKGKLSDRIYYNDGKIDDQTATKGMTCPLKAMWMAGTKKEQYTTTNMMSFNSYYDAARVPWRLATDYLWDTKSMWLDSKKNNISYYSGNLLKYVYDSFAAKWLDTWIETAAKTSPFKDGYTITGDTWSFADRDGFNVNTNQAGENGQSAGGQWVTAEFVSMSATAALREGGNPPATSKYFDGTLAKHCYAGDDTGGNYGYNYYGNTLRLLSLVMLTGKFENLYNAPPASGTMVRIRNRSKSDWFMNIENNVTNTVECYNGSTGWWSGQWTINRNAEGFYTFKNRWNNGVGYDVYLHCEDDLDKAEWDKTKTGKKPDPSWWSAQWYMVQTPNTGYYVFKNRWTGKRLTIKNMIAAKNGSVKVETADNGSTPGDIDQWRLEVVQ